MPIRNPWLLLILGMLLGQFVLPKLRAVVGI